MILINWKASVSKVVVYILLLVSFYFFCMAEVLNQYASQKTNFAKSNVDVTDEGVNIPALTFCFKPPFQSSMLKLHNITSNFCIYANQVDETNQFILKNSNMTWNEFCANLSYKLERDFTLDLMDDQITRTQLKNGINKVGEKEVEIREIFTNYDGLCYAMFSNLLLKRKNDTDFYGIEIKYLVCF